MAFFIIKKHNTLINHKLFLHFDLWLQENSYRWSVRSSWSFCNCLNSNLNFDLNLNQYLWLQESGYHWSVGSSSNCPHLCHHLLDSWHRQVLFWLKVFLWLNFNSNIVIFFARRTWRAEIAAKCLLRYFFWNLLNSCQAESLSGDLMVHFATIFWPLGNGYFQVGVEILLNALRRTYRGWSTCLLRRSSCSHNVLWLSAGHFLRTHRSSITTLSINAVMTLVTMITMVA